MRKMPVAEKGEIHRDKAVLCQAPCPCPSQAQGEDEEAVAHLSVCLLSPEQRQEQGPTDFLLPLNYNSLFTGHALCSKLH